MKVKHAHSLISKFNNFFSFQVVVVPDQAIFNEAPRGPGMVAFRKDTGRLYFRSNNHWQKIADERKVKNFPHSSVISTKRGRGIFIYSYSTLFISFQTGWFYPRRTWICRPTHLSMLATPLTIHDLEYGTKNNIMYCITYNWEQWLLNFEYFFNDWFMLTFSIVFLCLNLQYIPYYTPKFLVTWSSSYTFS